MADSKSKKEKKETNLNKDLGHKKKVLLKGIALHLLTYIIICSFLVILGVPLYIAFIIFLVLLWGLFVLSYILWYEK